MRLHEHSLEAYREERPRLSRREQIILDIYRRQPNRLFTDRDIQDILLFQGYPAKDMNYCRPRITDLKKDGYLDEVGETVDRATKKKVRLLRLARREPAWQMEMALA